LITVPEGAMQVICEDCNTWHFPSDENSGDEAQESSSFEGGYTPPPVGWEENKEDSSPDGIPPPIPRELPDNPSFGEDEQGFDEGVSLPDSSSAISAFLATDSDVRLALKAGPNVIGRKNADLIIEDKTVSRRHCVVEVNENSEGIWEYFIYDIGHMEGKSSTNGVFVSGRSLRLQDYERIPIYHGSSFRIGRVNLVLKTS